MVMLKMRFAVVAIVAIAAGSCSKQMAPAQPTPVSSAGEVALQALPFEVPDGAQFVARSRGSSNIYRIKEGCRPLDSMNPGSVVFFWTLEAGVRAGYRLSKEEGCR
jgi:hypothetical protein